ncbi:hypothetical protein SEA_NEOS5_94 [Mycobacterium phage Neos5]|nr:hypothetical protein CHANDLER_95 [Mycobacterium phage Chandler]AVJ50630.1 hypothetical protein PBI_NOZO_95 [Mycobacterium phage Nozo]QOI67397.1 hypothetical protein SEA_GERVAS_96 [Mycobacterium phage Gervas]QYW01707.1 hypothetical protein SEA_NEOS5_94 [Mycobacterium phage Neos5]WGH22196.1 hypothetical protein SEA_KRONUS_95 [Mycobacterium phage Kronus]WNM67013.1 hypothetical protein SEA_DEVONTE__93 [Mycobacterium phage Devonte]
MVVRRRDGPAEEGVIMTGIIDTKVEFHGAFVVHYTKQVDADLRATYTAMVYRTDGTLLAGHTRDSRREVEFETGLTIGRQMGVDAAAEKARRDAAAIRRRIEADEQHVENLTYLRGLISEPVDADETTLSDCPVCAATAGRRHFDECPFHPENAR